MKGVRHAPVYIALTAYNADETLAEAVGSILEQDFPNWCMTILDAGSSDNTWDLCQELARSDNRIDILRRHKQTPWYQNAKTHLKRSTSPFFMLADADDRWSCNWVSANLDVLENPIVDASFGRVGVIAHDGSERPHIASGRLFTGIDSRHRLIWQAKFALFPESTGKANLIYSLWRRASLSCIMPWHLETLQGSRDLQLLVTALDSLRIGSTPEATIFRRQSPQWNWREGRLADRPEMWIRQVRALGSKVPGDLPHEYGQATQGLVTKSAVTGIVRSRVILSRLLQVTTNASLNGKTWG